MINVIQSRAQLRGVWARATKGRHKDSVMTTEIETEEERPARNLEVVSKRAMLTDAGDTTLYTFGTIAKPAETSAVQYEGTGGGGRTC